MPLPGRESCNGRELHCGANAARCQHRPEVVQHHLECCAPDTNVNDELVGQCLGLGERTIGSCCLPDESGQVVTQYAGQVLPFPLGKKAHHCKDCDRVIAVNGWQGPEGLLLPLGGKARGRH